jgi:hypothetical protein
MSEPRIAGLVCEGQTDVPILRTIVQRLWPTLTDVRSLQPELDEMGRAVTPAGWTMVRSWCEQRAPILDEVLDPYVGDKLDLLVVALDVDIAIDAGIADPPARVGAYETPRLRRVMTTWLVPSGKRRRLPEQIVLSTPVTAIEAWVIAARFPRAKAPERIERPAHDLARRGALRLSPDDGKPWKELYLYQAFASQVGSHLPRVRKACPEAERTCVAIERRRDAVEQTP